MFDNKHRNNQGTRNADIGDSFVSLGAMGNIIPSSRTTRFSLDRDAHFGAGPYQS
jgi:hypothetical protein